MTTQITLSEMEIPCSICGNKRKKLVRHHIKYYPEEIMLVCYPCHGKIHSNNNKDYEQYRPKEDTEVYYLYVSSKKKLSWIKNTYRRDLELLNNPDTDEGSKETITRDIGFLKLLAEQRGIDTAGWL